MVELKFLTALIIGFFVLIRPEIILKFQSRYVAALGGKYEPPKISKYVIQATGILMIVIGLLMMIIDFGVFRP